MGDGAIGPHIKSDCRADAIAGFLVCSWSAISQSLVRAWRFVLPTSRFSLGVIDRSIFCDRTPGERSECNTGHRGFCTVL